ncbi:unnamed protein product [Bursaphelenchus xylophilus]|uniref:(pine wood nematode) hypothetical protein n=1 Tax=Bursaphelenchus xylophilus TaxID=6326 RepID=A0A1I7RNZ8_BURXY|nr:unnamed protein product [Bursaphelenchus xylophilus]CAG9124414.1 unnamed protein product [Bursaphelenchus xylophilus]
MNVARVLRRVVKYLTVFVLPTLTTFKLLGYALYDGHIVEHSKIEEFLSKYANVGYCVLASSICIMIYMVYHSVNYCLNQGRSEWYKVQCTNHYQKTFNLLLHSELFYFGISFAFLFLIFQFFTFGQTIYGNTPNFFIFFIMFTVSNLLLIILLYELEITKGYNYIIYLDFLLIFNNFLSNSLLLWTANHVIHIDHSITFVIILFISSLNKYLISEMLNSFFQQPKLPVISSVSDHLLPT